MFTPEIIYAAECLVTNIIKPSANARKEYNGVNHMDHTKIVNMNAYCFTFAKYCLQTTEDSQYRHLTRSTQEK